MATELIPTAELRAEFNGRIVVAQDIPDITFNPNDVVEGIPAASVPNCNVLRMLNKKVHYHIFKGNSL